MSIHEVQLNKGLMQAAVEDKQAGKLNKIAKVTAEGVKLAYFK